MPDGAFNTADGCTLAYTLRPARNPRAPRIVLIHSLALDRTIWDGVARSLAGDAHVLTYDCRGHGRSSRRVISFTPELFARDLAELLDHVGWPSARVAGCSMGGMRRAGVRRPVSLARQRPGTDRHHGLVRR